MNYDFIPADASCMEDFYALIDGRIEWMNEVGIRQWNATGYWVRYPREYYVRLMQAGQLYVLRREDGKIVGGAALMDADPHWKGFEGDSACYLHHFVTDVQEKGVGKLMLKEAENIARRMGRACLRLDCADNNPRLNRYYEEAGYPITGHCTDGLYSGNRQDGSD